MSNAPNDKPDAGQSEQRPSAESHSVIGPPSAAIPKVPPTECQNDRANKKKRWTKDVSMFWATVAGVFVVAAYSTVAAWQACLMRDQLTLAYPPKIKISTIHIWEKGIGSILNRDNKQPTFIPGTTIEGSVFALNYGRENAYLLYTYCELSWTDKNTLPQVGITWNKRDEIHGAKWHPKEDYPLTNSAEKEVAPGAVRRWELEAEVPETVSQKDLFLIGHVVYQDRLETRRAIFFARKYDPSKRRFFAVDDPENEGEE